MEKQQERTHKRHPKNHRDFPGQHKENQPAAVLQYGLQQEKTIEEVLSPFWAWRAVL